MASGPDHRRHARASQVEPTQGGARRERGGWRFGLGHVVREPVSRDVVVDAVEHPAQAPIGMGNAGPKVVRERGLRPVERGEPAAQDDAAGGKRCQVHRVPSLRPTSCGEGSCCASAEERMSSMVRSNAPIWSSHQKMSRPGSGAACGCGRRRRGTRRDRRGAARRRAARRWRRRRPRARRRGPVGRAAVAAGTSCSMVGSSRAAIGGIAGWSHQPVAMTTLLARQVPRLVADLEAVGAPVQPVDRRCGLDRGVERAGRRPSRNEATSAAVMKPSGSDAVVGPVREGGSSSSG